MVTGPEAIAVGLATIAVAYVAVSLIQYIYKWIKLLIDDKHPDDVFTTRYDVAWGVVASIVLFIAVIAAGVAVIWGIGVGASALWALIV